jgi:ornithine cyclodeaminase/alanine dehydrogenase-like protein (mu-crystallin family)
MEEFMNAHQILYLSKNEVAECGLTMPEVIEAVEQAFREKGEGRVEMPPKPGVHSRSDSFIHAMPAYIATTGALGVKWVAGYPENSKRGLPYISGLVVLNDPDTGLPLAVMDCVWITAMRTGAATAVAARYLAREDSRVLGVLGAGVQGFSNLEALKVLFPIERVVAYDIDDGQLERYQRRIRSRWPELEIRRAAEPREAVEGVDIVVTAGPIVRPPHATIQAGWLSEGAFSSMVDFDSYWSGESLAEVDKFITDDIPQLEHYRTLGYFQTIPPIYGELGELVTGRKPGRENVGERNVACNLGLAIDDLATAPLVYKRAVEKGLGTWLPL